MTDNEFMILHSTLIREVQGIEYDLKLIYSMIKSDDIDSNFEDVKNLSLGEIAIKLKRLDYSDNIPDLSEEEYDFIDHIRTLRNYWCHQCYVDYIYINNDAMRREKFDEISKKLYEDEKKTDALFQKLEKFRAAELIKYRR